MNLSILLKKLVLFISFLYSFIGFSQCDGLTVSLGNDLFYCANQQVTLTATVNSTNTATYSWTFQAAGSSITQFVGTNANTTFELIPSLELARHFLSQGNQVRILSPLWFNQFAKDLKNEK